MKSYCKTVFKLFFVGLLTMVMSNTTLADYPDRAITLLTAFGPGGGSDVSHRIVEKYAKNFMTQPLAIIYKPGAGGEFGWTELANAKPDGYFIGGIDLPHIALQPIVRKKGQPGYQTEDLIPVAGLVIDPGMVMVHKDSQFKTLDDLIRQAKKNPGTVTAATSGKFTGDHLFLMDFEAKTGAKFAQVPYSGGGKSIAALMGKQVDCYFGSANSFLRMESGRSLGVSTEGRYELTPDIKTLKEQGVNVVFMKRRGIAAPKGIPAEKIKYLQDIFAKMAQLKEYQNAKRKVGLSPDFMTSAQFADYIKNEQDRAAKMLKSLGFSK